MADRRRACVTADCPGCGTCSVEAGDFAAPELRAQLAAHLKDLRVRDERARLLLGWRDAADKRFREVRARINAKIGKGLGFGRWADRYLITTAGRRPDTRYYLPLPPVLIRLE